MQDLPNFDLLDLESERVCSVTLSTLNVHCCLCCGKYFQGRARDTPAFNHSIAQDHHLFLNLETGTVYSLPENNQVHSEAFTVLSQIVNPQFDLPFDGEGTGHLSNRIWGIKQVGNSEYISVVLQLLVSIVPLRNVFLVSHFDAQASGKLGLVGGFGRLVKRMWNPYAFGVGKRAVNPIQMLNAISQASNARFGVLEGREPLEFLQWFIHALSTTAECTSILKSCLQGMLSSESAKAKEQPFYVLSLQLPNEPVLAPTEKERGMVHQVNMQLLIHKWLQEKHWKVQRAPKYLLVHFPRKQHSQWTEEKRMNRCIVNFSACQNALQVGNCNYSLVGNVFQTNVDAKCRYRVHILDEKEKQWMLIDHSVVCAVASQSLFLQEAVLQLWRRNELEEVEEKEDATSM